MAPRVPAVLAVAFAAVLSLLIYRAAFPTLYMDELFFAQLYAPLAQGSFPHLRELVAAHHGHPYLLLKTLVSATLLLGLPWVWLMYAQAALLLLAAWGACLWRGEKTSGVAVLACCLVVLSPRQWENLYWGMGIAFALFLLSSLAAFRAVDRWARSGQPQWAYAALLTASLALVSNGAGIITLLLTCIANPIVRGRRSTTLAALLALFLGLAFFVLARALAPSRKASAATLDLPVAIDHALRMFGHQFIDGPAGSALVVVLGILSAALIPYVVHAVGSRWR
jgi:hypothetical protein